MSSDDQNKVKTEEEVSNVDLQFMGESNERRDLKATIKAESQAAKVSDQPEVKGLDTHDVAVAQSMDASDPPSTNMGDAEQ